MRRPTPCTSTNHGFKADSYTLSASGAWPTTSYDATCTTPLTTTPTVAAGRLDDVCVKVDVPAGAANDADEHEHRHRDLGRQTRRSSATRDAHDDRRRGRHPARRRRHQRPDVAAVLQGRADGGRRRLQHWDLAADPNLPRRYLKAHKNVVWFTGNSYPARSRPYEAELKAFLDGGGRLFMSGQDILDQAAGHHARSCTTTCTSTGTAPRPRTTRRPRPSRRRRQPGHRRPHIGTVPLDHTVLGAKFEDQITPIGTALRAFTDDTAETDALTYGGTYKVVFLAFPFEAYGTAADKADLMTRVFSFFGP